MSAIKLEKEGNWLPRPCEMGSTSAYVGTGGCVKTPKYNAPVYPKLDSPTAAKEPVPTEENAKPAPPKALF